MKKLPLLLLTLLSSACGIGGYPDRRDATIVVKDPDLVEPVEFSLRWWVAATSDVTAKVSKECDQAHSCVTVRYNDLYGDTVGRNVNWSDPVLGLNGSKITIDPTMKGWTDGQRHVVAHELGHSFEMDHVSNDEDLMRPYGAHYSCITRDTFANWAEEYGDNGKFVKTCQEDMK